MAKSMNFSEIKQKLEAAGTDTLERIELGFAWWENLPTNELEDPARIQLFQNIRTRLSSSAGSLSKLRWEADKLWNEYKFDYQNEFDSTVCLEKAENGDKQGAAETVARTKHKDLKKKVIEAELTKKRYSGYLERLNRMDDALNQHIASLKRVANAGERNGQ
jgi:hypothetical protein